MTTYEAKYLVYPSGSRLIRYAKRQKEVWLYENNSLSTTYFYLSLVHPDINSTFIIPEFDDQEHENK